jgi:hypothetical protein
MVLSLGDSAIVVLRKNYLGFLTVLKLYIHQRHGDATCISINLIIAMVFILYIHDKQMSRVISVVNRSDPCLISTFILMSYGSGFLLPKVERYM